MKICRCPTSCAATDLNSGQVCRFAGAIPARRQGFERRALGVPARENFRHEYVDGGSRSPCRCATRGRWGPTLVLAVDISSPPEGNPADGLLQILLQTFAIMAKSINHFELREADPGGAPCAYALKSADFGAAAEGHRGRPAAPHAAGPAAAAQAAGGFITRWWQNG